jgi:hypothetical protein
MAGALPSIPVAISYLLIATGALVELDRSRRSSVADRQ